MIMNKAQVEEIWDNTDDVIKKALTFDEFYEIYKEWLASGSEEFTSEDYTKWLRKNHPSLCLKLDNLQAIENLSRRDTMILKRAFTPKKITMKESPIKGVNPQLFDTPPSRTESEKRKERWEQGNWILESQENAKQTGGRVDLVIGGQKHDIPMLGVKEQRKFPRSRGPQHAPMTQAMIDIMQKETPLEIRSMVKELRNAPFSKWNAEQLEFARKYPDIANAIRQYQNSKKVKA